MAKGLTNAGIANRLVLSARTVETHVGSVMIKVDVAGSDQHHRRLLTVAYTAGC